MNRCQRRKTQQSTDRLLRNPVVHKLIDETATDIMAKFVIAAFENKPESIESQDDWNKIVGLVFTAGQKGTEATIEKVEQPDAPQE